jgi:hypothetical protein
MEQTQFVEKQFMQTVDSGAAQAMTAMLKQTEPAGDNEPDWMRTIYWARFIYSLSLRNPEQIRVVQRSLDEGSFSVATATNEEIQRANETKSKIRVRKLAAPAQFLLPNLINSEPAIRAIADNMMWVTYHVGVSPINSKPLVFGCHDVRIIGGMSFNTLSRCRISCPDQKQRAAGIANGVRHAMQDEVIRKRVNDHPVQQSGDMTANKVGSA